MTAVYFSNFAIVIDVSMYGVDGLAVQTKPFHLISELARLNSLYHDLFWFIQVSDREVSPFDYLRKILKLFDYHAS